METDPNLDKEVMLSQQLLIGEFLARNAFKFPSQEAFVFGAHRLSYDFINRRVNQLANALLAQNIKKGEKIGTFIRNRQELIEIFFAAAKIGAVNVPINIRLSPAEITYILNNSETKLLFVDDGFTDIVAGIQEDLTDRPKILTVGDAPQTTFDTYDDLLTQGGAEDPAILINDADDAFIIYTAGTTGRPKGAVLSHRNMVCNCLDMIHEMGLVAPRTLGLPELPKKVLTVAPLFHVAGIMNTIRAVIDRMTVVLMDFAPQAILETIAAQKITSIFLVPTMWRILLATPGINTHDLASVRMAGYGADVMQNSLKEKILHHFPNASLFEAFGQTEMSATTTFMKHQDALRKEGSVGLPLRMVTARVVDADMREVPVGEVGEIVYRGPGMFKGYYNNPGETRNAFYGGWFHSGDLVKRDEEGFLYIVDRKKDMILSGGENIYSAEVETVLQRHASVAEAAVIGVPDPKWGEAVKAFVVLKPQSQASGEEIIEFCTKHMARFKRPKHIEFIDALPRSATGKVLKKVLREKD